MERWAPIPGYPKYLVSDQGRVKGLHYGKLRIPQKNGSGYLCVSLITDAGKIQKRGIHCLMLEAFVGPRPEGMQTRHLDGNQTNNVLSNLCYGTHAENVADRARHGTDRRGERHRSARLSEKDVLEIRSSTLNSAALGRKYGVDRMTIVLARKGRTWTHL
jgi:hypothetical protein